MLQEKTKQFIGLIRGAGTTGATEAAASSKPLLYRAKDAFCMGMHKRAPKRMIK